MWYPPYPRGRFVTLFLPKVDAELQILQVNGINSSVQFSDWMVVIRKSDVSCDHYSTNLNDSLKPDRYPLLHADDIFAILCGCSCFSSIDLSLFSSGTVSSFYVTTDDSAVSPAIEQSSRMFCRHHQERTGEKKYRRGKDDNVPASPDSRRSSPFSDQQQIETLRVITILHTYC